MKKGIYLTIITVITVFCIIFGSAYHFGGFFSSLPFIGFGTYDASGSTKETSSLNLGVFDNIVADVSISDFTITHGDDYTVSYEATQTIIPKLKVKNGTLYIDQSVKRRLWGGFGTQNRNCTITITIPENTRLTDISLDSGVGDISIDSITADSLTTDTSVGDTEIKDCDIESIDADNDVGDITLSNCSFVDLDVDNNVGNITVSSTRDLSDYDIDLDTSIGVVSVNDHNCKREFSQDGDSDGSVTLDNSTGDITLKY